MTRTEYYAIIQSGCAIFGVGRTLRGAYRDAKQWADSLPRLADIPSQPEFHGDFYWAPVTPALYASIAKGSDDAFATLADGTHCTPREHKTGDAT